MKINSTTEAVESVFSRNLSKRKEKEKAAQQVNTDDTQDEEKKEKVGIFQSFIMAIVNNKVLIIVSCIFMFLFMCGYGYFVNSEKSSAKLSLNYEQASSGLYPNGTHFNIYDLCSEEVLNKALEYSGCGENVTADELAKCITIEAPTSNTTDYYIATSYTIGFKRPKKLHGISSGDMLSLICKAYKDYFFSNFAGNSTVLKTNFNFSDNLEYDEICQELCNSTSQTQNYLSMRIKEGKTFTASDGSTFNSLNKEVQSLIDYDLTDLNAYIWENGVLKDSVAYRDTLKYKNYTLRKSYKTYMIEYNDRMAGIDKYNQSMTASVLIPTYNKVYQFYMSRTKNGVDYLADDSESKLSLAEEVDRTLRINDDKISKAAGAKVTSSTRAKAESMIKGIEVKMQSLSKRIMKADMEYRIEKTKNYLSLVTIRLTTLQIFGIRNALVATLIFFVVVVYILHLQYTSRKPLFRRRRKKNEKV